MARRGPGPGHAGRAAPLPPPGGDGARLREDPGGAPAQALPDRRRAAAGERGGRARLRAGPGRGRAGRLGLRGDQGLRRREPRPEAADPERARPRLLGVRGGDRPGGRLPAPSDLLPLLRRAARPLSRRRAHRSHHREPAAADPAVRGQLPLLPLSPCLGVGELAARLGALRRRSLRLAFGQRGRARGAAAADVRGGGRAALLGLGLGPLAGDRQLGRAVELRRAQPGAAQRQSESQPDLQHRLQRGRHERDGGPARDRGPAARGDRVPARASRRGRGATSRPMRSPRASSGAPRRLSGIASPLVCARCCPGADASLRPWPPRGQILGSGPASPSR